MIYYFKRNQHDDSLYCRRNGHKVLLLSKYEDFYREGFYDVDPTNVAELNKCIIVNKATYINLSKLIARDNFAKFIYRLSVCNGFGRTVKLLEESNNMFIGKLFCIDFDNRKFIHDNGKKYSISNITKDFYFKFVPKSYKNGVNVTPSRYIMKFIFPLMYQFKQFDVISKTDENPNGYYKYHIDGTPLDLWFYKSFMDLLKDNRLIEVLEHNLELEQLWRDKYEAEADDTTVDKVNTLFDSYPYKSSIYDLENINTIRNINNTIRLFEILDILSTTNK